MFYFQNGKRHLTRDQSEFKLEGEGGGVGVGGEMKFFRKKFGTPLRVKNFLRASLFSGKSISRP